MQSNEKVFLLLQGPPSRFSSALSKGLLSRGAKCHKINLCLGDWLFWKGTDAINYRGTLADWPSFLTDYIKLHKVTDLVYYADRTPYHRDAIDIAAKLGANAITYENGYLRPHWITLEHGGMSRQSHFPTDPEYILHEGKKHPAPKTQKGLEHPFWQEAWNEVVYSLANLFDIAVFRHYQADKVYNPVYEYLNYVPRLLKSKKSAIVADKIVKDLKKKRFFLFPLQMQNDYQLRENSPFNHQGEAITLAIKALYDSAEKNSHLLFKIHPMDNGIEPWAELIHQQAVRFEVEDRIWFIDGGNLDKIMDNCKGIITINSTVGVRGIQKTKPVITLGDAMYDIPGLTSQQTLKMFFQNPSHPSAELVDSFVNLMAATIQIHGSFISQKGRELAIAEMCEKLITNQVNLPGAMATPPPRLKKG